MKNRFLGLVAASLITLPAWAGPGGGSAPSASSSSTATANGGAGGAGGSATGGAATGGAATGGTATGGAATGGSSYGNSSNINVSLTNTSGGSGADGSGATTSNATVDYGGSYTIKSAPTIAAPALTSTFSDTCMGSSSFGLSLVGFGATGGTTTVDDACVRRLDSREFRAMGMNDVALALLCQSPANRQAVEATGRSCPSAKPQEATATQVAVPATAVLLRPDPNDVIVRRRLGMDEGENVSAVKANAINTQGAAVMMSTAPQEGGGGVVAPAAGAAAPAAATAATIEDGSATATAVTHSEPEVMPLQDTATVTNDE